MKHFSLLLVALAVCLSLCGCNRERIPYLGHWEGQFAPSPAPTDARQKQLVMIGYLQLYRTDDKFLMQMQNRTQTVALGGTWRISSPQHITLTFNSFKLDEPPMESMNAMHQAYIAPDLLRASYDHPLNLELSNDGQNLKGLLMRVGPFLGMHEFRK